MISLSVDDGCASDVRLAELASKYEVPVTFYWPVEWRSLAYDKGYKPLTYGQALDIASDFEIGSHTITHRHLTDLDLSEALIEIAESKVMLMNLFKQPINKFCPPRGYTNEVLTEQTLNLYESQRLTKGKGLVHVHPNSGANGNIHWMDYASENEVEELWLHSWELDRYPNEWKNLEDYLRATTLS